MKLWSCLILSLAISLQSIGASAMHFVQISSLVEHFEMHQTEEDISFAEFLDLHYGSQKANHENEHEEHDQLPFQECHHSTTGFYAHLHWPILIPLKRAYESIEHNFGYQFMQPTPYTATLLQPPKQHA